MKRLFPVVLAILMLAAPARAADPLAYEPNVDPGVGFNLVSWWNFGGGGEDLWRGAVRDVHDAGFTEVSISPVRFVNPTTGAIAESSQRGPELSHIAAGIAEAKALGMTVTVNPFVEVENFAFWRGQYDPTPGSGPWTAFWDDYQAYLVDVAEVAQANGADAMHVGTELRAITRNRGNNPKWDSVIAAVDGAFEGDIGYAANWDNYRNGNLNAAVWSNPAIDFLGIDAYFRNTTTNAESDASGDDPNEAFIAAVEEGWAARLDNEILPFARSLRGGEGLPVVFTEVGYLPYNRTTVTPQNSGGPIDTDEQVMAFKGLMRAVNGRRDEVGALHIWQWGMGGSNGSQWNIAATPGGDQPNNLPLGRWLSEFVSAPKLAGDFNADGVVDAADYTVWRDTFGDPAGLATWRSQYGARLPAGVAIPEPGALVNVLCAAAAYTSKLRLARSR